MLDKQTYIKQVQSKLNNWKEEVHKLREKMDNSNKSTQNTHYQVIEEIVERQHLVENKLNEFKITGDEVLGHWETEIDNLRHQVQNAFKSARALIN
jgi:archaellum component FlaC